MNTKHIFTVLFAGCLAVLASSAHAGNFLLQPAAGHHWNGTDTMGGLTRNDGKISSSVSTPVNTVWVVPVQTTTIGIVYSGKHYASGASPFTRLAAFDFQGAFTGASAGTSGTSVGGNSLGTVFVSGTVFTQTTFPNAAATLQTLNVTF